MSVTSSLFIDYAMLVISVTYLTLKVTIVTNNRIIVDKIHFKWNSHWLYFLGSKFYVHLVFSLFYSLIVFYTLISGNCVNHTYLLCINKYPMIFALWNSQILSDLWMIWWNGRYYRVGVCINSMQVGCQRRIRYSKCICWSLRISNSRILRLALKGRVGNLYKKDFKKKKRKKARSRLRKKTIFFFFYKFPPQSSEIFRIF